MKEYGLDGIDIDWEYPGTSLAGNCVGQDRIKRIIRCFWRSFGRQLDAYREGACFVTTAVRRRCLLCTADRYEGEASRYLDYVQLMTYDLQGGFQKVTDIMRRCITVREICLMHVQKAVNGFVNAGVPMEKLILGVPFHSRKWDGVKRLMPQRGLEWKQRRSEDMAVTMASSKRAGSERGDLSGIGMSRQRFRICLTGKHLSAMRTA